MHRVIIYTATIVRRFPMFNAVSFIGFLYEPVYCIMLNFIVNTNFIKIPLILTN